MSYKKKPIPKNILIFGAGNHIGKPMANFLQKEAQQIKLRLVSSREEGINPLKQEFPDAEVVQANFMDLASLETAVDGIEGIYIAAPFWIPAAAAANNLVSAIKKSGTAIHIIRQTAMLPEYNWRLMPESLSAIMGGEFPDVTSKRIWSESGLPVTFLNFGASFMDNLTGMLGRGIREERKLIGHHRKVPFNDPRDIAEVAARLLLSDNAGHIGLFHTLNNNHDQLGYDKVAALMEEVYGEKIEYVGDKKSFIKEHAPVMGEQVAEISWQAFEFELSYQECWALNNFGERILGRKMTTLREWLMEHKNEVLGL